MTRLALWRKDVKWSAFRRNEVEIIPFNGTSQPDINKRLPKAAV